MRNDDEMQLGQVDINKLRGLGDKAVGLAKKFVGTIVDNDSSSTKAMCNRRARPKKLRAIRKEIEAQRKAAKADVLEHTRKVAECAKQRA
jgi:hypothetical protein